MILARSYSVTTSVVVFVVGADGRGSVTLYDNRQLVHAERFEELSVLLFQQSRQPRP